MLPMRSDEEHAKCDRSPLEVPVSPLLIHADAPMMNPSPRDHTRILVPVYPPLYSLQAACHDLLRFPRPDR